MNLPDLHRHLDGSLRAETLEEFAREDGAPIPNRLLFSPGMGLAEALACFAFTVGRLQSLQRLARVASELCEDARDEGVTTFEVRFAPQLHRGEPEAVVDAVLDGLGTRAGLILCGLYGEDPAVLMRHVEVARTRTGVVGIDLAGGPAPGHRWGLTDYAVPFRHARELGLGRTVHAAEGRSPLEIREAILTLHAQRIGHGTTLLDDPQALDLVLEHDVVIEACPTSNVHTGVIEALVDHPLGQWLKAGVRVCVNTDNTLLSAVTSPEEHARARDIVGVGQAGLERLVEVGHAAAFPRR